MAPCSTAGGEGPAHLVGQLHLLDNVMTSLQQAWLHESLSPIADPPVQDCMLRLLSSPASLLLLLSITARGPGLYMQTWKLLAVLRQLPPLTTKKTINSTPNSLGRGQKVASTVDLIDWAQYRQSAISIERNLAFSGEAHNHREGGS